jgi:uncharacterized protein YraI
MKHTVLIAAALLMAVSPSTAQQNPDDGGPDYLKVDGIGETDALNIRAKPSSKSAIVGRVGNGAILQNGGCAEYQGARWCAVTVPDSDVKGWAFGKYLREGSAPTLDAKVDGTPYNATGNMNCVPATGAAQTQCGFGVIRGENGNAMIVITLPDGTQRKIWFEKTNPVASDFGLQAAPGKASDETVVTLPSGEAFTIVDVFVTGD